MKLIWLPSFATAIIVLAGCVSPEEQRAMDQEQCTDYGFAPGTDAFAHCMMKTAQHREAERAADQRAAADRVAADQRARAAQDQADRDAWDKRTRQGKYANTSSSSHSSETSTSVPDLSGMNCTTTKTSSGTPNNMTTTTNMSCHN